MADRPRFLGRLIVEYRIYAADHKLSRRTPPSKLNWLEQETLNVFGLDEPHDEILQRVR